MEHKAFGQTGLLVSPLAFGGAPIGILKTEQDRAGTILNLLLDSGVNLIDTAATYAGSEEIIGKAVEHRRADCVLVSKCGHSVYDLPGEAWSAELIAATIDRALRLLRTDYLDVMLLHTCGRPVLEQGDALAELVKAREAGKIRFAGYSGDGATLTYSAGLQDIAVLEMSMSFVDQANVEGPLVIARERNVGVIAKRPVGNAAWKPPEQQQAFYRRYSQEYHQRFEQMGLSLEDFDVSDWGELALRFTLSIAGIHTAIVGTTSPENTRRNIVAAEKGPLPGKAVDRIRAAFEDGGRGGWPALH